MSDLIYLATILGFFAVAVALLKACEHIIGPDLAPTTDPATAAGSPDAATDDAARPEAVTA